MNQYTTSRHVFRRSLQHIDPNKVNTSPTFEELVFGEIKIFSSPFRESTCIPTPPTSLSISYMEEDYALKVFVEQLLTLNIRFSKFGECLGKEIIMARANKVVNELRVILDKDQIGL